MTFDFFKTSRALASTQLRGIEERTGAKARLLPITLGERSFRGNDRLQFVERELRQHG